MALLLSIMGVRALGETDLNPISGISKLAQLIFVVVPQSNKSSVIINLVAGAISEAGALQAGDLMQDLKTGHLLGAAPNAQFWGQVIGATIGAVLKRLSISTIQPAAHGSRAATNGQGMGGRCRSPLCLHNPGKDHIVRKVMAALGSGGHCRRCRHVQHPILHLGPSCRRIAQLVLGPGQEVVPHSTLIILASGFILGEGFLSIVNLVMQGFGVPHF